MNPYGKYWLRDIGLPSSSQSFLFTLKSGTCCSLDHVKAERGSDVNLGDELIGEGSVRGGCVEGVLIRCDAFLRTTDYKGICLLIC